MSARDKIHYHVANSLTKDGWTIAHDPLRVRWKQRNLQIDLGAERLLAAERGTEKIAVEIKSFAGKNDLEDLYKALGQFVLYREALSKVEPERVLYLAIDSQTYRNFFDGLEGESLIAREGIKLFVFNKKTEVAVLWKK